MKSKKSSNAFKILLILFGVVSVGGCSLLLKTYLSSQTSNTSVKNSENTSPIVQSNSLEESAISEVNANALHPLAIENMRAQSYPGSDLIIEQTLANGSNYKRYVASYQSEGLKIYGLLTVPNGEAPAGGWPAIIFNHGYIPPEQYRTTEKYVAYLDAFARNQYVVFKPDYRGHGNSEGDPQGAYYSQAYTSDVLNALASIRLRSDVNADKVGMWGHSMGGHITLRSMVIDKHVKAGVIWAGVVATYDHMAQHWNSRTPWQPSPREQRSGRPSRQQLIEQYGSFESNPEFWKSISANYFVDQISGPVQIHHGTADATVPISFSEQLRDQLTAANKTIEYYSYPNADHNLSGSAFGPAIQRSVQFFDTYLK